MSNIYDFCEYFYLLAKPLNKKEKKRIRNNLSPPSGHGPHVAQAARCVQKLYEAFQISMYPRVRKRQGERGTVRTAAWGEGCATEARNGDYDPEVASGSFVAC